MRIKPIVTAIAMVCAAQLSLALPQVEDAGDVLPSNSNSSGYLSSTPVAAPEVTQSVIQRNSNINDDLLAKINAMEQEVQSLQGRVDELQHELKRSTEENAVIVAELRKKVSEMQAPVAATAVIAKTVASNNAPVAAKAPPVAVVAVAAKTAPAVTPEAQEKATYDAAYSLVSAKAYEDAIEAFKGHLTIYPDGKYAPQANYWLGELNASQRHYLEAIRYLEVVVKQYPQSSKVPDALLKLGIINKRLGNDAKAQEWFGLVVKEYPQSVSAQSAKEYITN